MSAPLRVAAFFDGQNLYRSVKAAFGYTYPNYDPAKLAGLVCDKNNWRLDSVHFYTGLPRHNDDSFWNNFWNKKLAHLKRQNVIIYKRYLAKREANTPSGPVPYLVEKGIDVRIAIDIIRMALKGEYDVALIFSQDQDLSEVADEIRSISRGRNIYIEVASAFPENSDPAYKRGIDKTNWHTISKSEYDSCIDPTDYR